MSYEKANSQDGAVWNHAKKFVGDQEVNIESSDDTFIEGYYLGTKSVTTKNGSSNLHSFKLIKAGIPESIKGEVPEDGRVSVWGSMILDETLREKGKPGIKTKIHWEGKKKALTGGNSYNVFGIYFDHSAELYGGNSAPMENLPTENVPVDQAASSLMEGDKPDKLPF